MPYKKSGLPEDNEIVICTVKKILPHSIFVDLDEYQSKEGMIHISEIAPGRIRNIRDYVREGKKVVCMVLRVNREKNYIDLSLRRVPRSVTASKNNEFKHEQKAEKILEEVSKKLKTTLDDLYKKFAIKAIEKYGTLYSFFQAISTDEKILNDYDLDKSLSSELTALVKEKIRPQEVKVKYTIKLVSYASNGINRIKNIFKSIILLSKEKNYKLKISYLGAPKYMLSITDFEYKKAEKDMNDILNSISILAKNEHCIYEATHSKK